MKRVQYGEVNHFARLAFQQSLKSRCNTYPEGAVIISKDGECIGHGYRRLLVNDVCRGRCIRAEEDRLKHLCIKIHTIDMAVIVALTTGNTKKIRGSTLYCVTRSQTNPDRIKENYPAESISLIHTVRFKCCVEQLVYHQINVALRHHGDELPVIYEPHELLNLSGVGNHEESHQTAALVYNA